jgi:hypothetical protein
MAKGDGSSSSRIDTGDVNGTVASAQRASLVLVRHRAARARRSRTAAFDELLNRNKDKSVAEYRFIVFTDPVEGQEVEYNRWYDERHVPDVLSVPGFVSAQRFRANAVRGAPPRGYVTIYEIETGDIEAVFADLSARSRTTRMPISDALAPDSISYVYEAVGERRKNSN